MEEVQPRDLNGVAALMAAEATAMHKLKGEYDTEFVKRIVCAYLNADRKYPELRSPHLQSRKTDKET